MSSIQNLECEIAEQTATETDSQISVVSSVSGDPRSETVSMAVCRKEGISLPADTETSASADQLADNKVGPDDYGVQVLRDDESRGGESGSDASPNAGQGEPGHELVVNQAGVQDVVTGSSRHTSEDTSAVPHSSETVQDSPPRATAVDNALADDDEDSHRSGSAAEASSPITAEGGAPTADEDTDAVASALLAAASLNEPLDSKPDDRSASQQLGASAADAAPPVQGAAAEVSASKSDAAESYRPSVYQVKWVKWKDGKVPIITQNENGPCPLIAIMNVLLLLGKVKLPHVIEVITSNQLMEYVGDCILENAPKNISNGAQLNYEQNMHDAIAVLPKLQTGLDVNVKFTGVHDFEYTPECIIFDLLNIPLYHGWLVDPQAMDVVMAVGKLSYNQLVEKIITNKSSPNSDLITEALIAEGFLEKSASQLTYYGLCELNEVLKPKELAVLFRNNHFSTIFKHEGELLQLVTDQGFLNECNVVWETLSNIEGDCQFVDADFVTVPPKAVPVAPIASGVGAENAEQIQQDYLVALSLQEEQKRQEEKAKVWQEYKEKELGATSEMTDEELAWRLQAEEERQANQQSQPETAQRSVAAGNDAAMSTRQSSTESRSGRSEKKKSDGHLKELLQGTK